MCTLFVDLPTSEAQSFSGSAKNPKKRVECRVRASGPTTGTGNKRTTFEKVYALRY